MYANSIYTNGITHWGKIKTFNYLVMEKYWNPWNSKIIQRNEEGWWGFRTDLKNEVRTLKVLFLLNHLELIMSTKLCWKRMVYCAMSHHYKIPNSGCKPDLMSVFLFNVYSRLIQCWPLLIRHLNNLKCWSCQLDSFAFSWKSKLTRRCIKNVPRCSKYSFKGILYKIPALIPPTKSFFYIRLFGSSTRKLYLSLRIWNKT